MVTTSIINTHIVLIVNNVLDIPGRRVADMALLTFRYLQEIGWDLRRMQISMRLRGFKKRRFSPRGLRTLARLSGSL